MFLCSGDRAFTGATLDFIAYGQNSASSFTNEHLILHLWTKPASIVYGKKLDFIVYYRWVPIQSFFCAKLNLIFKNDGHARNSI